MNTISEILKNISRLAEIDSSLVENVSRQLVKLSEIDSSLVENVSRQLVKLSEIDSSLVENVSRQLVKLSEIGNNNIDTFLTQSIKALTQYPNYKSNLIDSISDGQNLSKNWLVEKINNKNLGNVFLCAGWYAMLLIDKRLNFNRCVSVDIDPICEPVSKILHKHLVINNWKYQAVTKDIKEINYNLEKFSFVRSDGSIAELSMSPDTIINTSCEHIENFSDWYKLLPKGKLVILQTNNGFDIPGHVNCVSSLEEFEKQTPLTEVLYSGEREMPKFTRYMRIGKNDF
jgi:hypothetical protein